MKGNAQRNGANRTRQINPHSVAGGTGSGRIVAPQPDDTGPKAEAARKALAAFKPRRMTKAQARLDRRKKHDDATRKEFMNKRKEGGHSSEYHTPGSMNK